MAASVSMTWQLPDNVCGGPPQRPESASLGDNRAVYDRSMVQAPDRYPPAGTYPMTPKSRRPPEATPLGPSEQQRQKFSSAMSMRIMELQKALLLDHERILGQPETVSAEVLNLTCMPSFVKKAPLAICSGPSSRNSSTQTPGPKLSEPINIGPFGSGYHGHKPPKLDDVEETTVGKTVKKVKETCLFAFSDTEAIKAKVREAKLSGKQVYNVHNCYYKTGVIQAIAKSPYFENITLSIIVANALWISFDTDLNKADSILDAKPVFITADSLFFGYFGWELLTRFLAFRRKCSCMRDGWFVFDTTLVALYAMDPFILGFVTYMVGGGGMGLPTAVLRLFRLARLSRLVRMLRSLPELMIMIKGMVSAAASVGYTLGLLLLITYVFAIALRNLVPPDADEESIETLYFSSVPEAMHNLIIFGTFLDNLADFMIAVKEQSTPCLVLTWFYVALASLTVMNMLIGVLCEVISAVAEEEKESMIVDQVNEKFSSIVAELDENNDGTLSWEEFKKILEYPDAIRALESVNVNPESMIDMAEDCFFDEGVESQVAFRDFMGMVLDLRGGQKATVKDIMGLSRRMNGKLFKVKETIGSIDLKLTKLFESVHAVAEMQSRVTSRR